MIINDTLIPKQQLDTVLSRGDEAVEDRSAPDFEHTHEPEDALLDMIMNKSISKKNNDDDDSVNSMTSPTSSPNKSPTKSPSQGQGSPTTLGSPFHKIPDKQTKRSETVSDDIMKELHSEIWCVIDEIIRDNYPDAIVILPRLPTLLHEILHEHQFNNHVMEQWCLMVLHLGNISQLGLAGIREMAGGAISKDIRKMMLFHQHDNYLTALGELCVELIEDDNR